MAIIAKNLSKERKHYLQKVRARDAGTVFGELSETERLEENESESTETETNAFESGGATGTAEEELSNGNDTGRRIGSERTGGGRTTTAKKTKNKKKKKNDDDDSEDDENKNSNENENGDDDDKNAKKKRRRRRRRSGESHVAVD